jgi:hypothetical protein
LEGTIEANTFPRVEAMVMGVTNEMLQGGVAGNTVQKAAEEVVLLGVLNGGEGSIRGFRHLALTFN